MLIKEKSSILLFIGTELTDGQVRDAYLKHFGALLKSMGIGVKKALFLPDRRDVMDIELARGVKEGGLVIITGGLGPTSDDITRDVVGAVARKPLEFKESVWKSICRRLKGREVSESNRKQALIPATFEIIENPRGTAPGFYGKIEETLVISLPGPPEELFPLVQEVVEPLVRETLGLEKPREELSASAFCLAEAGLEKGLTEHVLPGIRWQTRLERDRILFTLKGDNREALEESYNAVKGVFGWSRIKTGSWSMAYRIVEFLKEKQQTLALAESCTGGLIAEMVTDIPGSSEVFPGGIVSYSNKIKETLLGVRSETLKAHGAVSRETVILMARGALEKLDTHYSIAVSGIAGPGGGSEEKPVGTVYIAVGERTGPGWVVKFLFRGDRERIRRKTAVTAFLSLEGVILGNELLDINNEW